MHRIDDSGYSTLLMPDFPLLQPAPGPTLATAAALTGLRVGTTAAARAADSLVTLPKDPAAAAEEIQRRREEIGFSYFVIGADFADTFAPVVAKLGAR